MRSIQTITAADMKGINRSAILELIRRSGPISRSAIAEQLQVSLPTVMRCVDELRIEGLVRPTGQKQWSGGRKRALVEFNASEHLVIGIDLGGTKLYGAVADLAGNILYEATVQHHQTQGEDSLALLVSLINDLLGDANQRHCHVLGIGIGVPGVVYPETGHVGLAPSLDWYDFPLKARLAEHFTLPIELENDVNLAALGELWFGSCANSSNLVLIAIGTGIGAGIVINGMVYPGVHQMAGEIGYFLPDCSHLGQDYSGFGALEQLASGSGVAERGRKALQGQRSAEGLEELTAEDVFEAARRKEPWAVEVLAETIDYLALAIGAITLTHDPDVILLGGGVARSADLLIEPILARLKGAIPILPRLEASTLGYRAAVLGTIVKLLRVTSNYYLLQKFS